MHPPCIYRINSDVHKKKTAQVVRRTGCDKLASKEGGGGVSPMRNACVHKYTWAKESPYLLVSTFCSPCICTADIDKININVTLIPVIKTRRNNLRTQPRIYAALPEHSFVFNNQLKGEEELILRGIKLRRRSRISGWSMTLLCFFSGVQTSERMAGNTNCGRALFQRIGWHYWIFFFLGNIGIERFEIVGGIATRCRDTEKRCWARRARVASRWSR